MQRQYISIFITGFNSVVIPKLKNEFQNVKVIQEEDGLVVYETSSSIEIIKKSPLFNNTFILLESFTQNTALESAINAVLKTYDFSNFPLKLPRRKRTFRIVVSEENEMISIKTSLLPALAKKIGRSLSIRQDGSRPSSEFWFIKRTSGHVFFAMRLTYHPDYTKSLPKGALRPELAYLICLTADVKRTDSVWDPFAGYGTIPVACESHFAPAKIIANEHNSNLAGRMKNVRRSLGLHFDVTKDDVLQTTIPDHSITKIISDPPWGSFEKISREDFYETMLQEFDRVLTKEGTCTLLVGESSSLNEAIKRSKYFKLHKTINTLVAGKKATVYVLTKS